MVGLVSAHRQSVRPGLGAHDPESEGKYCTLSSSRQKKPIPLPSVELDSCTFLYRAPSVAAVSKVRTFGSEVSPYRG